ncbi:hypothetical protein [Croceicoccus estronivorus]|uniref:hypothetical protein n=1 Tax=Croceicoccus estronivorus TaxID=1172626 RepID=UPI000B19FC77|nr:hypothetical protein [Croceicoccus estronivorus]
MLCKWLGTTTLRLANGWWVAIWAVLLAVVAGWALSAVTGGKRAQAEAKLARNRADAALASGQDAVATMGAQGAAEQAVDTLTRENDHAIRSAEGAAAPVPSAVAAAGRIGLCKRAAYRGRAECLQFTPAPGMESGRSGRADP